MFNIVHIDEKWFNEDVDRKTYYLLPDEENPLRCRKSKRFIGKTMFLTAVARPRWTYCYFRYNDYFDNLYKLI